ncbi:hypothetical protein BA895_16675 [Humibacillus sp. DSM 29435]|uniref:hypothetical protein n=1 Tax=Humibacillus sp. DSM 29435 TaxID=1869167 RepID=UPI000871C62C|nr:hypothetical protein [Humibacillus sp. DSM 29435]OFE17398.1 hypothetical protein BA895_16675 [Humibacillus sp. DSM 29435]
MADLETDLAAEVGWDEQALASFAHVSDVDLAPVGVPAAAGLAPSLHLNLGDGYLRRAAPLKHEINSAPGSPRSMRCPTTATAR